MAHLKALRSAIGSYGRVAANGIVEVDESHADKLLDTKNFVRATDEDIEAAQKAQKDWLRLGGQGTSALFAPLATPPAQIEDAFDAAEIDQQRALLKAAQEKLVVETTRLEAWQGDLDTRQQQLNARDGELQTRQTALDGVASAQAAEGQRLTALAEELGARDKALTDLGADLDTRQTTLTEGEARLAADREAHEKAMAPVADAAAKGKKAGGS